MPALPVALRELIESGSLAHVTTINPDGSPQVSVIWVGLDGDDLVSGHMGHHVKVRNIERDPRVALSFEWPKVAGAVMSPYAVLHARGTVIRSDETWDLLNRLMKVYVDPDGEFPVPRGPGFIVRYHIERVGGIGLWLKDAG